MTDLLDYQQRIKERKQWNRTIANFSDMPKCEACGGPLEEMMFADEVNGVEYDYICKNPDCPTKQ